MSPYHARSSMLLFGLFQSALYSGLEDFLLSSTTTEINSYTTGLQPAVLSYMMNSTLTKKFGGHVDSQEVGLPVTESGLVLPCGASGRWEA